MGLEKFEKHFSPDFSGKMESSSERLKKENEVIKGIGKAAEEKAKSAEARRKILNEKVDPTIVDTFVHSIRSIEKLASNDEIREKASKLRETMVRQMESIANEPTLAEIHRRLAEETEDDDSQQ